MPTEEEAEADYRPPLSQMQNAGLVIFFVAYVVYGWVWAGSGYFNNAFAWGGWLFLGIFMMFKWGPMVIALGSPKGVSNKIGTTIASAEPVLVIPPEGDYPEMGVWPAKTYRSLGVYAYLTCAGYVICPTRLAYIIGEQNRGVNVFWNSRLRLITDHAELAPHIRTALRGMKRPPYVEAMPCYVGVYPLLVKDPTNEDLEEYRTWFERLGISRELFDGDPKKQIIGVRQKLEQYAADLSMFKYDEATMHPGKMFESQIKSLNAHNDVLVRQIDWLKDQLTSLQQMHKYGRDEEPERTWRDRIPFETGQGQQQQSDQNNRTR